MSAPIPPDLRPGLWIISGCFVCLGIDLGVWGAMVPLLTVRLALTPLDISLFLLLLGLSLIIAVSMFSTIMRYTTSRTIVRISAPLYIGAFILAVLAPDKTVFFVAAVLTGLASGWFDSAINLQAVEWEVAAKRKMLSAFHGMYTLGVMAGASYLLLTRYIGFTSIQSLLPLLVVLTCLVSYGSRWLLIDQKRQVTTKTKATPIPFAFSVSIGVLILIGNTVEGGIIDWSALYLQHELKVEKTTAGISVAVFACCMAIGRFSGDWLAERLTVNQLLCWPILLSAALLAAAIYLQQLVVTLIAFGVTGLAIANVFPVLLRLVAEKLDAAARLKAIARVIAFGYFGIISGPVLLGLVAEQYAYAATFYTIALLLLLFAVPLYLIMTGAGKRGSA